MAEAILEVEGLSKYFPIREGLLRTRYLHAVEDVSFVLEKGKTIGVIGETGSGKTTLGKTVIRLYKPSKGRIIFRGTDITSLPEKRLRPLRKYMQIVYQDPYSSLNPRMRIRDIIARPLLIHRLVSSREELDNRIRELLEEVELPINVMYRYPHELSGGQRQRVAIARALATEPELIVLDEPTSALDVSVQAQILNLLKSIQRTHKTSYIFISHDISVVSYMSDEVMVMYSGVVVEKGPTDTVINNPKHPYTRMLISSVPKPDPREKLPEVMEVAEPRLPIDPPPGCRYRDRCPYALHICSKKDPPPISIGGRRTVRCWLYSSEAGTGRE